MGKHSNSDRSRSRSKSSLSSNRRSDMTIGAKRKHSSPSNSELSKISKHTKRSSSSSSNECSKEKKQKNSKRKHKSKQKNISSSDSESDTSTSSSSADEREKRRKEKKRRKKEKKLKKKLKKETKRLAKQEATVVTGPCISLKSTKKKPEELSERAKAMAPMTKEEWDKRQSVFRRVYDEETGRQRLIKGDGEIIEEIVCRDRHMAINRQATKADGDFYQATASKKKK